MRAKPGRRAMSYRLSNVVIGRGYEQGFTGSGSVGIGVNRLNARRRVVQPTKLGPWRATIRRAPQGTPLRKGPFQRQGEHYRATTASGPVVITCPGRGLCCLHSMVTSRSANCTGKERPHRARRSNMMTPRILTSFTSSPPDGKLAYDVTVSPAHNFMISKLVTHSSMETRVEPATPPFAR